MGTAVRIPEFFVSRLDHIELLGSNSRYVMAIDQTSDGKVVFVPRLHIIMPNAALPDAIAKAMQVPCNEAVTQIRRLMPMWMH